MCYWEFYGKFDAWIYGSEELLKFVDLIFPGGTMDIINIHGTLIMNPFTGQRMVLAVGSR